MAAALPGDIDGPHYYCPATGGCATGDAYITNFRFNPSFRPDMILFRELIGGVTDALYFKPNASYKIADGFNIFAAVIYSRAIYATSTPSTSTGPEHEQREPRHRDQRRRALRDRRRVHRPAHGASCSRSMA